MNETLKELEERKLQPVNEKEEDIPPQKFNSEDNDFSTPLKKLLEGNHGRFL